MASWLEIVVTAPEKIFKCNREELARIMGVSSPTVGVWQEEGMPILERGGPGVPSRYSTASVIRWVLNREMQKHGTMTAKERLDDIRAKREEFAHRRDLGEVVTLDDVAPAFEQFVSDIDGTLAGLPEKYAQRLDAAQGLAATYEILNEIVRELRDTIGNYEPCTAAAASKTAGAA